MSPALSFVDTHAHLPMLTHDGPQEILARARAAGLTRIITISTDETNWESNRRFAEREPDVFYTVGLHPHDAARWKDCGPALSALFKNGIPPRCVAIGEMGMDFHYNYSDRDAQVAAFEEQLALAKRFDLPAVIHGRNAFPELFAAIKRVGAASRPGVMHCFTGTTAEAKASLDLGFKISFSGILTFKNASDLRETAKTLPLTDILIETDCPYLAPIPHRGKANEPAYVGLTAAQLAATRGAPLEEIAQQTTQNAIEFFRLS